jgi:hypothetical protein
MKNYNYQSTLKNFKNTAFHKSVLFLFILYSLIIFAGDLNAQKFLSLEQSEMEERSLEERTATKEPKFFDSRISDKWIGLYFGVGFRKVKLQVADAGTISDSDGEANGIGFFTYQEKSGQKLEVIQNNFWYIQYPKINRDFYLHYGSGIQFTKTRFAGTASNDAYEDEIALGIETGFSFFVTSNLLIYYRFSLGQHLTFLTSSSSNPFLKQSQLHTIYLNYFFPL